MIKLFIHICRSLEIKTEQFVIPTERSDEKPLGSAQAKSHTEIWLCRTYVSHFDRNDKTIKS